MQDHTNLPSLRLVAGGQLCMATSAYVVDHAEMPRRKL